MNLLRFIILFLLFYLGFRLLRSLFLDNKPKPRVRQGRSKRKPDPFEGADIEDIPYTELPPEESEEEGHRENTKRSES